MVGYQHTDIPVFQVHNYCLNIVHSNRVNASKRLIKQNKFRIDCQGSCNFGTSALASRQLETLALANMLQAEFFQKLLGHFVTSLAVKVTTELQNGLYVILDRHFLENRLFLRQIANAQTCTLINRQTCYFLVIQENTSAIRLYQAYNHIKGSRLASTIWTEQTDNLTLVDFNINTLYNGSLAVLLD